MRVILNFLIALIITTLYCISISYVILADVGIDDLESVLLITFDGLSVVWMSFYQFLVDNSFCPWLMIVRGRPTTEVLLDISYHLCSAFSLTTGFDFVAISELVSSIQELLFGPLVGFSLLILWGFISNYLYSLVLSKFVNRRK